jgi:molecular chaperone DnaJ
MELEIEFAEAVFGVSKQVEVKKTATCKRCDGSGAEPGGLKICSTCNGSGQVIRQQGFFSVSTPCPSCRGKGQTITETCKDCKGKGEEYITKKIEVKIPAGIEDAMTLRLSGEGNDGIYGGPPGDLFVFIRVKEHKFFKREGRNIYLDSPVSFVDATLGTTINVPTLKDFESITIKPGTQPGDQIVLKGKGIPDVKGYGIGNMYINIKVVLPTKLSKKQKELLEQFKQESNEDTYKKHKSLWDKITDFFQ